MQNSIEFPPDDSTGSESLWYPCFLVCDPHRFFRFHQRHTFASIYLDQEEEEWKQMLAEAPVLDVSTSDFWFFAASRDLTLLCRDAFVGVVLSPLSRYFWMMCFLKQISYISWYIYIYTISSKNELPHPSFPFQTQPTNRTSTIARQIIWCQLLQPSRNCLRPTCKPLQPISADLAKDSRWFHW